MCDTTLVSIMVIHRDGDRRSRFVLPGFTRHVLAPGQPITVSDQKTDRE